MHCGGERNCRLEWKVLVYRCKTHIGRSLESTVLHRSTHLGISSSDEFLVGLCNLLASRIFVP